jgi:hypothetical protein
MHDKRNSLPSPFTEFKLNRDADASTSGPIAYVVRFKVTALSVVAKMNSIAVDKIANTEHFRRQILFVQSQLLDAIRYDEAVSTEARTLVENYHAKCVRDSYGERRSARNRQKAGCATKTEMAEA